MRNLGNFLRRYQLLTFTLAALLVAAGLALNNQQVAGHWLLSIVSLVVALRLIWDMVQEMRLGNYGVDILAIAAIVTSVILGQYWAAIVVVLMLTGGKSLEDFATHRARRELEALGKRAPHSAIILRKGKEERVALSAIHVGDKLVIKAGDIVPVDAVIIEGTTSFDEALLSDEPASRIKEIGDNLWSGSINLDAPVTAKAIANAEHSQFQRTLKLMRSAASSRSPYVRLAERFSFPFMVAAFAIAVAVWVVSGQAIRFLDIIIVATPGPLLLAAPFALTSGLARASRYNIIVRTGAALERLAEAETIAFGKTGILTGGQLAVDKITVFNDYEDDEVLRLAASLEQNSTHAISRAILQAAQAKSLRLAKAKHVKELPNQGVQAHLQGQNVLVGRSSLLEEMAVTLPAKISSKNMKQTAAYVAVGGVLAGVITFTDEIRPKAAFTLHKLSQSGAKKLLMITGDAAAVTQRIGKSLGINDIHAGLLPAQKLHLIEAIPEKQRPVVFIGDGVDDAPMLASANVGIALGARASLATHESADILILDDEIGHVAIVRGIARRTFRIAAQSIIAGMALTFILMGIFATGKLPPLAGALLQEAVDVAVIFNALRARL